MTSDHPEWPSIVPGTPEGYYIAVNRYGSHPRWRKIRSHFRATLAADPAHEPVLDLE